MAPKKRLISFTADQQALLLVIRDKWLALGLSTAPADRPRAEAAIRIAYQRAGLEPPALLMWLGSPMAGVIGAAYLRELKKRIGSQNKGASVEDSVGASVGASVRASVMASVGDSVMASVGDSVMDSVMASVWASVMDSVRASVWASVGASVRDSVRDSVMASVGDSVWASVMDSVWASVGASVGASVRDSVRASVMASVMDSVRDSVRDSVWASVGASVRDSVGASVGASVGWGQLGYGQHDAGWIGFYDALREFGLGDLVKRLDGLTGLTESSGWYWPFKGACILTERHTELRRDGRGRLHSADSAAVRYPDGWAVYAWHGVRVAEAVIVRPESITVANVQGERNAEVRRVLLERYGFDRFITDSGALPIHADETGTLYRTELEGDEPLVVVRVKNSTPETDQSFKHYSLRVPGEITTAREAVAWTFGQSAVNYRPSVET